MSRLADAHYNSISQDAFIRACPLSQWGGENPRCRWCDKWLPKRRRRWCSNACADMAASNHYWTNARHAAKKRDGYRCVRCGRKETPGEPDSGLEVHHRDERANGRHTLTSCVHHVAGLETLCHACHVAEHTSPEALEKQRREELRRQWREGQLILEAADALGWPA